RQVRKELAVPGRRSVFDHDGAPDHITLLTQPIEKCLPFCGGRIDEGRHDQVHDPRNAVGGLASAWEWRRQAPEDERQDAGESAAGQRTPGTLIGLPLSNDVRYSSRSAYSGASAGR